MQLSDKDVTSSISIMEFWQICVAHYVHVRMSELDKFLTTMEIMNMNVQELPETRYGDFTIYQWINPRYEENEIFMTTSWLREFNADSLISKQVLTDNRATPIVQKLHTPGAIDIFEPFNFTVPDYYSRNILFSLAVNDRLYQNEYANAITFNPDFSLEKHTIVTNTTSKEADLFLHAAGKRDADKLNLFRTIYDAAVTHSTHHLPTP